MLAQVKWVNKKYRVDPIFCVARNLFLSPVASDFGLGVGLYQAARQATRSGYRLELPDNHLGRVTFRLQATGGKP